MSKLWIRAEVFDHVCLSTAFKWTLQSVFECVAALHESLAPQQTRIDAAQWMTFAGEWAKKGGGGPTSLTAVEAEAYWAVFATLCEAVRGIEDGQVDVRELALLLLVQLYSPQRMKNDQKADIVWPQKELSVPGSASGSLERNPLSSPRSAGSSPRSQVAASTRARDNHGILLFVQQNAGNMLRLASLDLSPPPSGGVEKDRERERDKERGTLRLSGEMKGEGEEKRVDTKSLDFLGLIIAGGASFTREGGSLSFLHTESKETGGARRGTLRKWIEGGLVWNDALYPSPSPSDPRPNFFSQNNARSSSAALISGLSRTTVFRTAKQMEGRPELSVVNCSESTLYICCKVAHVHVAACRHCTIFVAAVGGQASVVNCEGVRLVAVAGCVKFENSVDSVGLLHSRRRPVLAGDSRGLLLGPFNAIYSELDSILEEAGMTLSEDQVDSWANPICCTLQALTEGGAEGKGTTGGSNAAGSTAAGLKTPTSVGSLRASPTSDKAVARPSGSPTGVSPSLVGPGGELGGGAIPLSPVPGTGGGNSGDALSSLGGGGGGKGGDALSLSFHFVHPRQFAPLVVPEREFAAGWDLPLPGMDSSSSSSTTSAPSSSAAAGSSEKSQKEGGGKGKKPSLVLPDVYREALEETLQGNEDYSRELRAMESGAGGESAEMAERIRRLILARYREWLHEKGRHRLLLDLIRMEAADSPPPGGALGAQTK
uniref:C-CAP/cofactor C-like domain-containing protein n=1 Tax=Chromera velia CCMP2878 TaxID=1169474 RepID=A0A0G4I0D4_9ALVE|eukprot:Cvel_9911.t1-p1 / transcript=Cvel_9911.t1 / gene=Cvel_9911 / organism=Chromera_velia_CCMP2878 / gene_product=hypothetical protein / transcript_product=hypothetical protein / location=Cvel_scaffold585:36945-43324(-) / protein_length=713 / sequence_SO=supercontig / SO=protein_coding / is_pseudo=false